MFFYKIPSETETIQMSIKKWRDSCSTFIQGNVSNKKERATDIHNSVHESHKHDTDWNKPATKQYMLYDST